MSAVRRKPRTFGRSLPSLAYELEFRRALQSLVSEMRQETEAAVREYWQSEVIADSPYTDMMSNLRKKWYTRFNTVGRSMSRWLADKANKRTETQITRKLSEVGWTLHNPEYSDVQKQKLRELSADSVSYIKSIPQKYLKNVQRQVTASVLRGGDEEQLTKELTKLYLRLGKEGDKALDYAALVARDQSNKMTQGYAIANATAYGARYGRWIHVQGVKSSRETHEKFDGQKFDLDEGLFDEDVGDSVVPGELAYCACQFEVLMPGFEDADEAGTFRDDESKESDIPFADLTDTERYNLNSDIIREKVHEVEMENLHASREIATAINMEGKVVATATGEFGQVKFDSHLADHGIFTHNHHTSSTFSEADIVNFANSEIYEMRATTPAGNVYSLTCGVENPDRSAFYEAYRKEAGEQYIGLLIAQEVMTGRLMPEYVLERYGDFLKTLPDKFLKEHAEEFGFIYKKGTV